jgi:hypothetical protein
MRRPMRFGTLRGMEYDEDKVDEMLGTGVAFPNHV